MTEAEELVRAGEPRANEVLVQAQEAIAKCHSAPPAAVPKPNLREVAVQRFRALLKQVGS